MSKKRPYLESHPWLTFNLNLDRAGPKLWMLLGEASSKCEHIAGVPLLPAVAKDLHKLYLVKGVMGTTAIEGNTLTENQVRQQVEGNLILPESQEYLGQEVQNVLDALELITPATIDGTLDYLTPSLIKRMNEMILKNLKLEEGVEPGRIRPYSVAVGNYRGAPYEDCEFLLERLCETLNRTIDENYSATAIGIIKAIFAHLYIAWIHPFGDGNGRTSRLMEFFILLSAGVSTPTAHLLSNHYNQTRSEYYRQLDYASKSGGDIRPFLEYAVSGLVEGLKAQIKRIRVHQLELTWQYYVYELYKERHLDAEKRRRDLLIEISKEAEPVWIKKVRKLNGQTATAYAKVTERTLLRDIDILADEGLVEVKMQRVRAKKELIESFLPNSRIISDNEKVHKEKFSRKQV